MDHWQRFKTGDFEQKWNSSKLILKEGKSAIAPLLDLLNDRSVDAETHWFTIRALGHFPHPDVVTAIADQIGDAADYSDRTAEQAAEISDFAIETLAAMGNVAIDLLSQLLRQPQRRLLAAKALNQVRSSGVIPSMVSVARDDNAQVRYYAIDALGSFHSEVVTDVLLSALQDPAADVRKAAVMALGRRRDLQDRHQLSQQLQPLLWDINIDVSCQAAMALGRLVAEDGIDALHRVLLSEHTPMALRIDTVRALEWYCDAAAATDTLIDQAFNVLIDALGHFGQEPAIDSLSAAEMQQVQIVIIRVLGDLRYPAIAHRATEILIQQLQHRPAAPVAQASIMALANLGQPQAFDALLPLLNHPADVVPIHTIAALKRLDPDHSLHRVTDYINHFPARQADVLDLW